jgi:excisionase family DNA binding protein
MGTAKKRFGGGSGQRRQRRPGRYTSTNRSVPQSQGVSRDAADTDRKREPLLTEAEAAEWLGLSPLTLRKWRCLGTHPLPFLKIGKTIRYCESDVLRFLESHMVVPLTLEAPSHA